MKYIILVGDGMADYKLAELGMRTPLEAAQTPAMDELAAKGKLFTLHTVPDGFAPGSDVANLSLLGYLPQDFYTGRAPLEAASMGVVLASDEIAYRCNLVTVERSSAGEMVMVDYSAGHISTEEAKQLIETLALELDSDLTKLYAGVSYRHLLVCKEGFDSFLTVPPHDHTGGDVTSFWNRYLQVPLFRELVEKAAQVLANHPVNLARVAKGLRPANGIWLWGEGKAPSMPEMKSQFGVSGALISAVDLLKGIGVYAGMEVIDVPGATGYLDTNYKGKADAAISATAEHDLVFVHVEAPDEAGHQGLVQEKIQAIEDFDQKIVKPVVEGLAGTEYRLALTCDHFTPVETRTHAGLPVPMVIFDSRECSEGSGLTYSEQNAESSNDVLMDGAKFFSCLLER